MECKSMLFVYEPNTLSLRAFKFFFSRQFHFLQLRSCFSKWYEKEWSVMLRVHNGGWHETLNLIHVSSYEMFTFLFWFVQDVTNCNILQLLTWLKFKVSCQPPLWMQSFIPCSFWYHLVKQLHPLQNFDRDLKENLDEFLAGEITEILVRSRQDVPSFGEILVRCRQSR